jgi:conjugative relaxase-like TrwC/TraI family protein
VLSIGKLALGQQAYYERSVAQGQDDYYSGRGEVAGEWAGAGAGELGLVGRVSAEQFNALLEGRDPRAMSERLRASNSEPAVAAFDLTFSAPKSVSVLFAIAPAEMSAALVECHEEAVRAALGWLEDEAVFVRRGKGGLRFEHAGGLIAAAYRHRMSRALDPQLHTHVVCANLARGEDGRYTALHHPSVYRAAKTAGYLYQGHLRWLVYERLGLEWAAVRKGAGELARMPEEVLRVFSRRSAEIEPVIAEREAQAGRSLSWLERKTWGTLATRDRKQYSIETHTWREEMTAIAGEHGADRQFVEELERNGTTRVERGQLAGEGQLQLAGEQVGERELAELLTGAGGLTARSNTFDEMAVLREFAAAAPAGSRVRVVREQLERFIERDDVLPARGRTLTSVELVEREASLIAAASSRVDTGVAQLGERTIDRGLATSDRTPNEDQLAAVRAVARSGNGVDVIEALAGTGKTYTAGALRDVYEHAGYTVLGVAPTGRAARELSDDAGIPTRTLDSRVLAINNGSDLPAGSVLVFDEAGMAGTRLSEQLLANAAKGGVKVVAIGDPGQLASVQAGGWLGAVGERVGPVRLTEVMRQRDPVERLALAGLHDGDPARWIEWAEQNGRVEVLPDTRDVLERAVDEWAAGAERNGIDQSVMISRDNQTRQALNALAREYRRGLGQLGSELTYGSVTLAVGDRVICRRNEYRELDVDNGTRGTVRHVERDGIEIETDAHITRELPAAYVAEQVEHAYTLTGHGMQGGTVEQAVVVASPHELTRGWSYTALSRARDVTRLLVRDVEHEVAARAEYAPAHRLATAEQREVLASVARQMRVRDDEDLAIDQLVPGRADDPQLIHRQTEQLLQERAAERAEPGLQRSVGQTIGQLRERIEVLRAQLAALPVIEMRELDDLETRARELTQLRDRVRGELDRLPPPVERRFRQTEDPYVVDRHRLSSALAGAEDQLERTLTRRGTLARQLGDPAAIRDERDGLRNAITTLGREHTQLRNQLADHELQQRPRWMRDALGERPATPARAEAWDDAARTLARYRISYEIPDNTPDLGERPPQGPQRDDYDTADRAREQVGRQLERQTPGHDIELG